MNRWLARILVFFGFFFATYVLYAHVSSWRMAARTETGWSAHLRGPDAHDLGLSSSHQGLDASMVDGNFTISGKTADKGFFHLQRPAKRFDSGLLSARFRFGEATAYDVVLGYQLASDPRRRVAFAFSNDPTAPQFRVLGTDAPNGPLPVSDGVLSDLEPLRDLARSLHAHDWHELAVRFDPPNQIFEFFVDAVPVESIHLPWMAGLDVEAFVGVEERQAGSDPHVAFDIVSFNPGPSGPPVRGTRFVDEFPGSLPDPLRWQTLVSNDWRMQGGLARMETGSGLHLEARAEGVTALGLATPVEICRYPAELDPLHIETKWDVRTLRYGMLYVSIRNINDSRFFEAAIHGTDEGRPPRWIFTGQSERGIEPTRTEGPPVEMSDGALTFDVGYDPWLRRATVRANEKVIHQKSYDLSRKEYVRICVGGHISTGGAFDATLERISVRFAPY